jgi:hypothetical protein
MLGEESVNTTRTPCVVIVATTLLLALSGCEKGKPGVTGDVTSPPSATAPPVAQEPPGTVAGDLTAKKVEKPLGEWQSDDVKSALEGGGWKVTGATQTKSAMLSIIVSASRGETKAKVNYYKDGGPSWKKRLEKDGAAIHEEGDVILGVVIENDKPGAQKLLDSLLGK